MTAAAWLVPALLAIPCFGILAAPPAAALAASGSKAQCPSLAIKSSGPCVTELQRRLDNDAALPHIAIDGYFGVQTRRDVEDFQRRMGITKDGIAGPGTVAALNSIGKRIKQPSSAPTAAPPVTASPSISPNFLESLWQTVTKYVPPRSFKAVLIDCAPVVIFLVIILAFFYLMFRHKDTREGEFTVFWILKAKVKKRPHELELRAQIAAEYLRSNNQLPPPGDFFRSIGRGDS